jgi:tRNA A37 threonylcarbamoyladenosine dehydratase
VNFITRILDSYFKKEQEIQALKRKQLEEKKMDLNIEHRDKRKHQIFAGIVTVIAMFGFAFSKGIVQVIKKKKKTI